MWWSDFVKRPGRRLASLGLVLFGTLLAGCGFHLRGQQDLPFQSVFVPDTRGSELSSLLKRGIRTSSKAQVADSPKEAQAIIVILRDQREKSILSLNASGRVREFELRARFGFRVVDANGQVLVPDSEIVVRRDMTFDDSLVLAKQQEEALIYRDMQKDLVQQILRRLAAARIEG
ncbi:MAG: hypothetical protein JNJ60_10315 [Rhodocyclaceae bacterium]|nr:hypothetical protein [Rhodocyclaceae bacterium]